MLKHILIVLVACTLLLLNTSAIATPVIGIWSQILPNTLVYSLFPATDIWYFSSNPGANDATSIKTLVETQFNVSSLTTIAQCDNPTSGCTNGAIGSLLSNSIYTNDFTSPSAFNYLAIHFGGGELLFYWAQAINDFQIGGLPNGLSNYRAYSNDFTAVSVTTSGWLLASGLGFLCIIIRRLHR